MDKKTLYANIIIDISLEKLDRTFQYLIPEMLADQIYPGTPVEKWKPTYAWLCGGRDGSAGI